MPKRLTKRTDILRKPDIDNMLQKADPRMQCIIALAWLFGKRINEILRLRKQDVWVEGEYLFARFKVGKKKSKSDEAVPKLYLKKIRAEHPYTKPIRDWIEQSKDGYLFPATTQAAQVTVRTQYKDRTGQTKTGTYHYTTDGGHLSRVRVWQFLKQLDANAWPHLFRESLATHMAENGASEEELMHWFDWDDIRTAHKYVKYGTKLTEKWSDRKF